MNPCLTIFDPTTNAAVEHELPISKPGDHVRLSLTRIPGSTAMHIRITESTESGPVVHRMEIPAGDDSQVPVIVSWLASGRVVARSPGRATLYLPSDPAYGPEAIEWIGGPVAPIVPPPETDALELAVLIDATTRHWRLENEQPTSDLLLGRPTEWAAAVDGILEIAAALADGCTRVRVAILAFADERPSLDSPQEISPQFLLYPPDDLSRQLSERPPADVEQTLLNIPASSGADYVDALGEGLQAVGRLEWDPNARRILLVFGDSPGYSVVEPAPWGADARVRTVDVDTEANRLHRRGVEVITIFSGPPRAYGLDAPGRPTELLLRHAREQYRRIATTEKYAVNFEDLAPDAMAANVRALKGPLARGATWPCFVKAESISGDTARRVLG